MQVGPVAYILLVGSADVLIFTTPQESNISDLGKRKIIFKSALVADILVPWRVSLLAPFHMFTGYHYA